MGLQFHIFTCRQFMAVSERFSTLPVPDPELKQLTRSELTLIPADTMSVQPIVRPMYKIGFIHE